MLVRHAESEGNLADLRAHEARAGRLELDARDADVALSQTGQRQAAAVGNWLAGLGAGARPTAMVSSPYVRAASTADVIAEKLGVPTPVDRDERLRERDLGMFDGLTGRGIRDLFPEEAERRSRIGKFYYRPPGGESWCDVVLRVRSFVDSVLVDASDDRIVVVTHQAVIMNFRYVLESLTEADVMRIDSGPPLANCSVTTYRQDHSGALELVSFNDVEALASLDQAVTAEEGKDDKA
jgi:broad specificity phosphatase PhoE